MCVCMGGIGAISIIPLSLKPRSSQDYQPPQLPQPPPVAAQVARPRTPVQEEATVKKFVAPTDGRPVAPSIDENGDVIPDWKRRVLQKKLSAKYVSEQQRFGSQGTRDAHKSAFSFPFLCSLLISPVIRHCRKRSRRKSCRSWRRRPAGRAFRPGSGACSK